MTDFEILTQYMNGALTGITVSSECLFMPVRITGLGETQRVNEMLTIECIKKNFPGLKGKTLEELIANAEKEKINLANCFVFSIVDRNGEEFKNLENYNGLPILKEHPANGELLNFNNLKDNPIIGTIIKPFIKNGEIWGIAKIYDINLLSSLQKLQSTSPAVVSFYDDSKNDIINETPKHFNHLAFVEKGHWDQVSNEAFDCDSLQFNLDKEKKMQETTEEKIKTLENAEKREGEAFQELANEHKQLNSQNPLIKEEVKDEEKEEAKKEEVKDEEKEEAKKEEVKDEEKEEEVKDEEKKEVKEEVKDEEKKEAKDDDEVLTDEEETQLDAERWALINNFKDAQSRAHSSLNVKMPHIDKRLNPSATISRILKLNSHLCNRKYDRAIDSKYEVNNYQLQMDAFNDLLSNIEKQTEEAYKKLGKTKNSGFVPTAKDYIQIDKNF